jgi:hypothetical protein
MKQLARVVVPSPEIEIVICNEGDETKPWMPPKFVVIATKQPVEGETKPTVKRVPFRTEDDLFEALDDLRFDLVREWKSIRKSLAVQFAEGLRQARRNDIKENADKVNRISGIPIDALDDLRSKGNKF